MSVDPKYSMWFNILASVVSALMGGAAMFTDLFGQGTAQKVMAGLGIAGLVLGAINTGLHNYSAPVSGPGVSK